MPNYQNGETMAKLKEHCIKCGVVCNGKCLIETRKGSYKVFCSDCFVELEFTESVKKIRELLKGGKNGNIK